MINGSDATREELVAMVWLAQGQRDEQTGQTLFDEMLNRVRVEGHAVEPEIVEAEVVEDKKAKK